MFYYNSIYLVEPEDTYNLILIEHMAPILLLYQHVYFQVNNDGLLMKKRYIVSKAVKNYCYNNKFPVSLISASNQIQLNSNSALNLVSFV